MVKRRGNGHLTPIPKQAGDTQSDDFTRPFYWDSVSHSRLKGAEEGKISVSHLSREEIDRLYPKREKKLSGDDLKEYLQALKNRKLELGLNRASVAE